MDQTLAVIFDVDGVLVDSYQAHFESWRRLCGERGAEMSEDLFSRSFGRTSRDIVGLIWPDRSFSAAEVRELEDRKEAIYRQIVREAYPAMGGAAPLIESLAEAGFALAVGSSGPPENVELALQHLDPHRRIGARVTGRDVTRGKPDPQVFQLAARRLGVPPARCAVLEDAPAGVEAARAAGMVPIALASTGRTRQELHRADLVIDSLRELSPETIRRLLRP